MTVEKLLASQPENKQSGAYLFGIVSFRQVSSMPEHIKMTTDKKCTSTVLILINFVNRSI